MALTYIDRIAEQIRSALPPKARPLEHADELYRLYALLALARGQDTTLENVHDAWSTWMSVHDPSHESLRPFRQLDASTRNEDRPYLDAIRRVSRDLSE